MVQEGVNHYNNLRETLHKLTGHRGYQAYFESWTPSLMEDEGDDSINELFVQETMDPRIESAMPILSRLKKPVTEMEEIDTLAEWADSVINEKLELDEGDVVPFKKKQDDDLDDDDDDSWMPSEEDFEQEEKHRNRKRTPANDVNEMDKSPEANPYSGQGHRKGDDNASRGPDKTAKMLAAKKAMKAARKTLDKAFKGDVEENFIGMAPQAVAEEEVEESGLQAYLGKKKYGEKGMKALQQAGRDGASKEKMASIRAKHDKLDEVQVEEDLDANQKRAGQLGPTEKVKNNNIGKLVGANESTEIDPELARIMEMARFKR